MADLSKGMWDIALQPLETYFCYHNDYGHHTWQGSDLPSGAPTHKISWPFNHVVLQNDVTIQNHYNSINRVAVATTLCRMVNYLNGALSIKSYNTLIIWTCKVTWQMKTIISLLPDCLLPPNLAGWWLTLRGSDCYSNLTL